MKRQFVTVKDRVELRKIKIKQLLGMIGTIDAMIADERPFESVHWSEDSLKLDETMKPEAPNVNIGDACKIEETGEAGTWQKDDSGDFICVPNEIKSPFVPEAPEQSENAE